MADTDEKSYSGELFDLSIPSINDRFGAMHIIGVMQYGINFPLSKFIKELQLIIDNGTDDKTAKRRERLAFLKHCNGNRELRQFFILFCNYLNGQDGTGTQYPNYMVMTAAGGNIMILFAQLIKDIIDNSVTNLMSSNKILLEQLAKLTTNSIESIIDSIKSYFTSPEMVEMLKTLREVAASEASDCDFKLSPNIIPLIDNTAVDIISSMFRALEIEPPQGGNAKIGGVDPITNPFGTPSVSAFNFASPSVGAFTFSSHNFREPMALESLQSQQSSQSSHDSSESSFYDLEDDLSPSKIELLIKKLKNTTKIDKLADKVAEIFAKIKIHDTLKDSDIPKLVEFIDLLRFLYENIGSDTEAAGFLLYRIKTLIQFIEFLKMGFPI